jgi:S1-C subfamily serine protease
VPAVQIFTAAHPDYHRPSDTADKIDVAGLARVAAFVKEGIVYLAERPEPLTNTINRSPGAVQAGPPSPPTPGVSPAPPVASASQGRRVSLGTVPDFAFPGPGVRVTGLVPDSPAVKADIREGDVILRINDAAVGNLQEYANLLRTFSPGQIVTVVLRRGAEDVKVSVTLGER